MAKEAPITLSSALGVSTEQVLASGVVDVTLNCDTNLFPDPLLMREASDEAFANAAYSAFVKRFERIISLLVASNSRYDKAERAARELLTFPEIRYTHLGFSQGTSGAGFGAELTDNLVESAKQVISIGMDDPDLFLVLALFERNVGPDRIGDMTTNIIIKCLSEFNCRVAPTLSMPVGRFRIGRDQYAFPVNPLDADEPVILMPSDVVRQLPVATDWDSVRAAAKASGDYKKDVNNFVGEIWAAKSSQQKQTIRNTILRSRSAFEELLELIRDAADEPYDVRKDVAGELFPSDLERQLAENFPLDLKQFSGRKLTLDEANKAVINIIRHFQELIEQNGIWKELWLDDLETPRLEKAVQRIFFVTASAFCKSNNLDLSPEANSGAGPIDFKISSGSDAKVLVEIKRSMNTHLIHGYTTQLEVYKRAEATTRAHYVIVDVGHFTQRKKDRLRDARDTALRVNGVASEVWTVDGSVRASASKR